ncbi:hypothetical protein FGB62_2g230 [Gracilaria domingensis]|nr:hypothetical protein FGB62_2g230 [Gracilaria domingensis]
MSVRKVSVLRVQDAELQALIGQFSARIAERNTRGHVFIGLRDFSSGDRNCWTGGKRGAEVIMMFEPGSTPDSCQDL